MIKKVWIAATLTAATMMLAGCESKDARLARLAENSVEQQKFQNQEMARLNRDVAQGVKQLVISENVARKELVALQRDVQNQQSAVGQQRDQLEIERKQLAGERHRESLLVPAITSIGLIIACALPLILAWYLLNGWSGEPDNDIALGDLLVEELVSDRPSLLPSPQPTATLRGEEPRRLAINIDTDCDIDPTA
jgi:hypothetical protein